MAEPPNAKYRQALSGLDLGPPQGSVHRDPGAKEWRSLDAGKPFRNFQRVSRGRLHELCVTTVYSNARNLLFDAKVLVAFATESALPAGPGAPPYPPFFAPLQIGNRRSLFPHAAFYFVPENQRSFRDRHD